MIIDWAIIIAVGVYRSCKTPSGPLFANKKYTISPTTTGGIPIRELEKTIIKSLKIKFLIAKTYPNISAINEEINRAEKLTFNDRKIIWYKVSSNAIISFTDSKKISKIFINNFWMI